MRKTSTSRTKKNRPKIKLGIPDLEHSYGASALRIRGVDISMPLMSSSLGTVPNHDWPSTRRLF